MDIILILNLILLLFTLYGIFVSIRDYKIRIRRFQCRLDNRDQRIDDLLTENAALQSSNKALCQLINDHTIALSASSTYHVRSLDAGYFAVIRRCQVRGRNYDILIKRFTDPDTAYNLSEAEDLCDKLNEK